MDIINIPKLPEIVIPADISELTDTTGILAAKVDVVEGKGLSTNDFTDDFETKLTGIDAGANNYVHPTGDGNLHVPANGTTNNGEVLTAGATAGAYSWEPLPSTEKSLLDYINEFDMTPPENGVCFLTLDKNLNTGALIPIGAHTVTCQDSDNWLLKRYDIDNNVTDTQDNPYGYNANFSTNTIDSILTPFGNLTKYSIEPKTAGKKFTIFSFSQNPGCVKIVCAGNSLDELPHFNLNGNTNLIDVIFPTSANTIAQPNGGFLSDLIKSTTLPASMSSLTSLSNGFKSKSIEEIVMPAATGIITTMAYMCDGNSRMKKFTFNLGDFNSLTALNIAWQNCLLLDTIENFPTSLNALTTLASTFKNTKLTAITLPASLPSLTTMNEMVNGCYDLITLTLPTSAPSVSTVNTMCQNSVNIETITECTNWGTNQIDATNVVTNCYKLTTFKQSSLKVSKIGIKGTAAKANALTSIDIDYANSLFAGSSPQIDFSYNSLSDTEIDRIFTALPNVTGKTIVVTGNPGAATCDPTIATAKGWTVTTA